VLAFSPQLVAIIVGIFRINLTFPTRSPVGTTVKKLLSEILERLHAPEPQAQATTPATAGGYPRGAGREKGGPPRTAAHARLARANGAWGREARAAAKACRVRQNGRARQDCGGGQTASAIKGARPEGAAPPLKAHPSLAPRPGRGAVGGARGRAAVPEDRQSQAQLLIARGRNRATHYAQVNDHLPSESSIRAD